MIRGFLAGVAFMVLVVELLATAYRRWEKREAVARASLIIGETL